MKRNVYVPDELDDEMTEHPQINWSEVFQDAVRAKIAELRGGTKGRRRIEVLREARALGLLRTVEVEVVSIEKLAK